MGYAKIILVLLFALGQKYPERKIAREGNEAFERGDLAGAAARYDEVLKLRETFTEARFNLGNTMLAGEKTDEAIELYKAVLRAHPDDADAKYNLAYAQKLRQEQEQEQEQEPREGEQPEEQPQQPESEEGEQPQGGGEQPEPGEQGEDEGQGQDQGQGQLTEREAEQMLEAMQAEEDNTREEMEGEKVPTVGRSGKNW